MQTDFTFATRVFGNPDPLNGIEYELKDSMVRKPGGSFYLIRGTRAARRT